MPAPVEIGSVSEWNTALRSSTAQGRTVFVDFHAEWCGPCKAISPRFAQLATQFPQALFLRVDVDRQRSIAAKYQISAMPTFIALKAGQQIDTMKGADNSLLTRLVSVHAGPNPPAAPLNEQAEKAKSRGNEHFKHGRFDEAVREYGLAIEASAGSPTLYANRSIAFVKLVGAGQSGSDSEKASSLERAVEDARKAVSIDPHYGKGFVRLGEALLESGKVDEAVEAFETAVAKSDGLLKSEATKKLETARAAQS